MIRPLLWNPKIEINILAATVTRIPDNEVQHLDRVIVDWDLNNYGNPVHVLGLNKSVLVGKLEITPTYQEYQRSGIDQIGGVPLGIEIRKDYHGIGISDKFFSGDLETANAQVSVTVNRKPYPVEYKILQWLRTNGFRHTDIADFFDSWFYKETTIKSPPKPFQRINQGEKRFIHPEIEEDAQKAKIIGF